MFTVIKGSNENASRKWKIGDCLTDCDGFKYQILKIHKIFGKVELIRELDGDTFAISFIELRDHFRHVGNLELVYSAPVEGVERLRANMRAADRRAKKAETSRQKLSDVVDW